MKQQSLFYGATYAMFLLSLAIMACVIVLTLIGRLFSGPHPTQGAIYGPRTATRAMVADALGSIEHGKQMEHGLVATMSDEYELVSITQTNQDKTPIGFFCGSTRSDGYSVVDGPLYEGVACNLYHPFNDITGATEEAYEGVSLNLTTGVSMIDIPQNQLPPALTNLTDGQLYGDEALPDGVTRLDADWYNTLQGPSASIVTSEDCMGVILGNVGAVTLFGLLFGIAWAVEKMRKA